MRKYIIFMVLLTGCSINKFTPKVKNITYTPDFDKVTVRGIKITKLHTPFDLSFRHIDYWDNKPNVKYDTNLIRLNDQTLEFYTKRDTSACIKSNFIFKYGKVGALIKFEDFPNNFPAFWLMGFNLMPEIDIIEYDGNRAWSTIHFGYSYEKGQNKHVGTGEIKGLNPTEYNWYECEVTPYWIKFYVNGQETAKIKYPLANNDSYVQFNSGYTGEVQVDRLSISVKGFYYIKY